MARLMRGDVVAVTKLDRLGRSTRELLELIERIGNAGASFRSLGDPLWDTSSSPGRLLSTLLAAIADFERDLVRERTGEGRKRAMANGVKFGRKRKLSDYQRTEAIKRRDAGETLAGGSKELRSLAGDDFAAIASASASPLRLRVRSKAKEAVRSKRHSDRDNARTARRKRAARYTAGRCGLVVVDLCLASSSRPRTPGPAFPSSGLL
jgi:Resolvase, N terminal domain